MEAFAAGIMPNINPMSALNPNDRATAQIGTLAGGKFATELIIEPPAKPSISPTSPPSKQRNIASIKNCNNISNLVAPSAFWIPI